MNKFLCFVLSFVILLSSPVFYAGDDKGKVFAENTGDEALCFYVDGKTDGTGTVNSPFETLEDARDTVRDLRKNGTDAPVTVYIRGGEYFRDSQFILESSDYNLTFCNYPGEEVIITGGRRVDKKDITKVTEKSVLDRIIDVNARNRLFKVDLSDYVDSLGAPFEWSSAISGWDETMFSDRLRIVVNGSGLDDARWPNTTANELKTKNMSNPGGGTAVFGYDDTTGRAKLWSQETLSNLLVCGHFEYYWTHNIHYATVNPDTATVTTKSATKGSWANDMPFYFINLIEEIDMPGESYTDVSEKAVYFYGYGNMENPEVYIPVSENRLFSVVGSKNLTIRGINFAHSKSKLMDCYEVSNLTVDDCDFTHFGGRNYFYGDHITIKNCYFYGNAVTMIDTRDFEGTYPGNSSLILKQESAENVFENNRFNLGNAVNLYSSPALSSTTSKGMTIRNNDIYNAPGNAISFGASIDVLFEKNHMYNCVSWAGDMGAVYWHSNPASFGHEIRYNFFENNASELADGWAQTIFADCCSTGAWIHHNVFNQGTLGTSEGGKKFAVKSLGGQFSLVENNVFIDTPYAVQFQTWYPYEDDGQQTGWWLHMYGKTKKGDMGDSFAESALAGNYVLINSPEIKEKYKGTPWEGYFDYVNSEYYWKVQGYDANTDADTLKNIAKQYAPKAENTFRNNVMVGSLSETSGTEPSFSYNGVEENTYIVPMDDAPKLFEDYENGSFSMTQSGTDIISKNIKDFDSFELKDTGAKMFERDGGLHTVGGNAVTAENARVEISGNTATVKYDIGGLRSEGRTLTEWFIANTANGTYRPLNLGSVYDISCDYLKGKYIKCRIYPYDIRGVDGETVETDPVLVPYNLQEQESGRIVRSWHMEPNGGTVTNLGLVCSSLNQNGEPVSSGLSGGKLIENKTGSAVGIDGSGAASYKSVSYMTKSYMALNDYLISDKNDYLKPGYTYFKSAMMKLNPGTTDVSLIDSGKQIWTFHEFGNAGFLSEAGDFAKKLDRYCGNEAVPGYDWLGTKPGTVKYTLGKDWTRVSEAMYVDRSAMAEPVRDRAGWVVWGYDWNTVCWTGNWEIVVDDYILLEVPNSALKSVAYPVAYDAKVMAGSEVTEVFEKTILTASAQYYDVNALINETSDNYLTFQWQRSSDGKVWTDIEGAVSSVYAPVYKDGFVRAKIKAVSKTRDSNEVVSGIVESSVVYSQAVKVKELNMGITVSVNEIDDDGFSYTDLNNETRSVSEKSIISYCRISNYVESAVSDYGIIFRLGDNELKLPGFCIGENGEFGIRMFGDVIESVTSGDNYSITGYFE